MNFVVENLINQHIQTLNSKTSSPKKDNTIRLDKGELPYPPSPQVIQAITNAASEINRYPEVMAASLRKKLAEYTGKLPEQITIGNGSDDLIELIIKVFVKPEEEVLLPIPTFFVYEFATRVIGGIPVWVKRQENFDLDVEAIIEKLTSKTKILFIANPNNPTANLISRDKIIEILNRVNCIVVVDECYYEFCQETVADLVEEYPNLIILRSLSKSFGLAGIRIGYSITNQTITDYLYRAAQLFPVNKLAIAAGNAALENLSYVQSSIEKIIKEKDFLTQELEKIGLKVYPSATNFLFIKTNSVGLTSKKIVELLREKNILIADFGLKQELDEYNIRIAIGTPEENKVLIHTLNTMI